MSISEVYQQIRKNFLEPEPSTSDFSFQAEILMEDYHQKSLAIMHERLYRSRDLTRIDFSSYLQNLVKSLLPLARPEIAIKVNSENVFMDIDSAVLCGSLVTELVINALKHAFPEGCGGEVLVELSNDDAGQYRLIIRDDGVGLDGDRARNGGTPGLNLILMLIEQLGGHIDVTAGTGASFYIMFRGARS